MTEHELLEELRLADPAPVDAPRPEAAWSSAVVLQRIEQRSGTMQTIEHQTESRAPSPRPGRRRGLLVAAGAMIVVILAAGAVIAIVGDENEPDVGSSVLGPITSFEHIAGRAYELQDTEITSVSYFFEDGTWHVGYSPEFVEGNPAGILETRFEGTKAFLTNVKGACTGPSEAIYEIHLLENGNLRLVLIEDPCTFRANFFPGEWAPLP